MSGPRLVQPLAVRAAGGVRIEPQVVVDHHDAVFGDRHVALDGVDAEVERLLERRQRVLGHETPCAAMALEVERVGGEGDEGGEKEDEAKHRGLRAGGGAFQRVLCGRGMAATIGQMRPAFCT